jgi:hypothetical protein
MVCTGSMGCEEGGSHDNVFRRVRARPTGEVNIEGHH